LIIDDGNDIITLGCDDMASTGWVRRSNGQTISVDLTGKNFVSARVRFRGVDGTTTSYEYRTSSPIEKTAWAPAGVSAFSSTTIPSAPDGYTFYRANIFASVAAASQGDWWISATVDGSTVGSKDGSSNYGSMSVETTSTPGKTINFTLGHEKGCTWLTRVTTVGRKAIVTPTHSTNPSCGGGSYSGTLTGGSITGWYNISLGSDRVNNLTVSVGGSGQVDVEIEYTYEIPKLPQSPPSTPIVSGISPSSVTLTSDPGSLIVCNGQTKSSGSTWTGLSEQTTYSAYAYFPETETHERSPNSGSTSFRTPSSAGPPSVITREPSDIGFTSAVIAGNVTSANGDTPERFLRWGYSPDGMVFELPMGEGTGVYSIELSGLEPGTTYYYQAYAVNKYGTGNGAVRNFSTPYPILEAPVPESPDNGGRFQDRRPWLIFTLTPHPDNPAELYHARARVSEYSTMSPVLYTLDSATGTGNWEYWDGAAWLTFPAGGVAPGTRVRCRTDLEMPYRAFYWDCAAHDGVMWGQNSLPWTFRILIAVSRTFTLVINDQDVVGVKDIVASETCNGEIGEISFSLDNKQGQADEINYNDLVILGINDKLNNVDEFRALVREKVPQQGKLMRLTCTTGDGILAERIVKQDYPAQDIGLSLKHAIDTYGAPLTSLNINTSTGIVAELKSKDKTLLQMFEEARRDYNQFYRVDNDWDVSTYFESDIEQAIVQIQYGANGITLMGGM
jgi:hypothetical protein